MPTPAQCAEMLYRAQCAPWDIGEAQPVIRQLVAVGAVKGHVLDPGCGTGHHAIRYAQHGCTVTGIDAAPTAIDRARRNAQQAGVQVNFKIADATRLDAYEGFDTVVDAKFYDNLDSVERQRYVAALHRVTKPGAKLFMFAFGPGHVNGIRNELLDEADFETVLPAAGFAITYAGETTYRLVNRSYLPDGRQHIPMLEIHAERSA